MHLLILGLQIYSAAQGSKGDFIVVDSNGTQIVRSFDSSSYDNSHQARAERDIFAEEMKGNGFSVETYFINHGKGRGMVFYVAIRVKEERS